MIKIQFGWLIPKQQIQKILLGKHLSASTDSNQANDSDSIWLTYFKVRRKIQKISIHYITFTFISVFPFKNNSCGLEPNFCKKSFFKDIKTFQEKWGRKFFQLLKNAFCFRMNSVIRIVFFLPIPKMSVLTSWRQHRPRNAVQRYAVGEIRRHAKLPKAGVFQRFVYADYSISLLPSSLTWRNNNK